jgi:hypothetical protein
MATYKELQDQLALLCHVTQSDAGLSGRRN